VPLVQVAMVLIVVGIILRFLLPCRLSGCAVLFFGVESVSPASPIGLKKSLKSMEQAEEAFRIIQDMWYIMRNDPLIENVADLELHR